jgi:hypothetical protein
MHEVAGNPTVARQYGHVIMRPKSDYMLRAFTCLDSR